MTEQDILNKIKESADSIEIPESLKPEKIELKLKEEKKPAKFRWQAMHLVAAAVVLVVMLGIVPLGLTIGGSNDSAVAGEDTMADSVAEGNQQNATAPEVAEEDIVEEKQDAGELYVVAKNYDEVYDFLKNNATVYEYNRYYYGVVMEEAEAEAAEELTDGAALQAPAADMASGSDMPKLESAVNESANNKQGYSTTNLQMAGVDESDIVKTNGSHIFMVKDGVVQVVKIDDGKMTQIGTLSPELESFSDSVNEMYVDGDKLVLIVQQVRDELEGTSTSDSTGGLLQLTGDTAELCVDYAYNYDVSYVTVLYTYDISNPANAKQIGKIEQDGYYKTSRKIDDMIYLFTQDSITVEADSLLDENEMEELLPTVNGEAISYDCIYLPEYGYQSLVVSSVPLDNPNKVVDNTLIMNNSVEIYVSSSAMYLYNSDYMADTVHTQIAKFSLKNGRISAVAAATVPGTIQDTFAINEYDGNLRVLTSHWDINIDDRTNQLYILDEKLKAAGKIENIAEGETIYAARYFGDLAYFITYRNIDPLFAADLSDINNPKILGELEITGYSEYLHMWGEDKLLGIGYETDPEDGRQEGIKLVMFDISNPAELSIIDTVVLKNADYSAALYNYKCVLADLNTNMIGFTTRNWKDDEVDYHVYSFANGEFEEELVIENKNTRYEEGYRGLWAGDYFYMVNPFEIKSYNYVEDYETVDEFEF
ncbi:MAG: beta-propeller domain-containing protein [Roseburia sp.]|nr:beta-propeller domain-containing protein [Roseburia sp.]